MIVEQFGEDIRKRFYYWQARTFLSIYFGYIFYYFTRKSFTFAIPVLSQEWGMEKSTIGLLVTIFSITYGLSKFINGILGDQSNPRYFMSIGLITTGICNVLLGFSNSIFLLFLFWAINGWFQGFGWPPCARLLTHWYSHKNRGTWWSIWSTSHNVGGGVIPIVVAYCTEYGGWRYGFIIPGIICIVFGIFLIGMLRDTPESLALPSANEIEAVNEIAQKYKETKGLSINQKIFIYIIKNPWVFYLSMANFFVYFIRTGLNDWVALYLSESQGYSLVQAGSSVFWFEFGGIFGMLLAGFISDKNYRQDRSIICLAFMALMLVPILMFWSFPSRSYFTVAAIMFVNGLFLFGPQMLIGCTVVEKSHPDLAATASGFTGIFGYAGAAFAGYPLGSVIENFGWNGFFVCLFIACLLGIFSFLSSSLYNIFLDLTALRFYRYTMSLWHRR